MDKDTGLIILLLGCIELAFYGNENYKNLLASVLLIIVGGILMYLKI